MVIYIHTFTVVLLAKGLYHEHMTMHSCLCQHDMTAHLYMIEIAHAPVTWHFNLDLNPDWNPDYH